MSRKRWYIPLAGVVLAAVLALVLVFGVLPGEPGGTAGEGATVASPEGTTEGIHVSGHWTIEVREPDGTLVSHNEFENLLTEVGEMVFSQILGRQSSKGPWGVELYPHLNMSLSPWLDSLANPSPGYVYESDAQPSGPNIFKSLTVTVDAQNRVVLTGTATAAVDGEVQMVRTIIWFCDPNVAPVNCTGTDYRISTAATLASAVPLSAGQQVLVEVIIDFS